MMSKIKKYVIATFVSIACLATQASPGVDLFKAKKYEEAYKVLTVDPNPDRFFYLGVMNLIGKGTIKNHAKAEDLWRKGWNSKDERSGISLALMLMDDKSKGAKEEGLMILKRLSSKFNSTKAMVELAKIMTNRSSKDFDLATGFNLFKSAADNGSVEAMSSVGLMYYYGDHVEKDLEKSEFWYKKAAELGFSNAQYALGIINTKKEKDKAVFWLTEASNKNHPEAIRSLVMIYEESSDTMPEAVIWARKGVELGINDLKPALGVMLLSSTEATDRKEGSRIINNCAIGGDSLCRSILITIFMKNRFNQQKADILSFVNGLK